MPKPDDEELAAYRAATDDTPEEREDSIAVIREWPIDGRARRTEELRESLIEEVRAGNVQTANIALWMVPRLLDLVSNLEGRLTGIDGDRPLPHITF